ncbi:MAG: Holliday junction resolvase RuvX [Lachnospiraceae bacterium]|nr:Holliday junction resolvase RuvX [Lachnospiraceae bacterium]
MRILGLDYGTKTVGVAISDELLLTAQPLMTITRDRENKIRQTLSQIEKLCEEYCINDIVLGYPKNMDNSIGEQAAKTEEFAELLRRRTGCNVILWDERLSSISAGRILNEGEVRGRKERKQVIDKLAASIILETYLDSIR